MRIWRKKKREEPQPPGIVWEPIGTEVSVEGSLCQAAQAIDIAGEMATSAGDSEILMDVAERWTKLADFIVALSDHEEKKHKPGMGFQPDKKKED